MGLLPEKYRDVLSFVADVEQPKAEVSGVKLLSIANDSAKVAGVVRVNNPNPFGGTIDKVQYQLEWRDGNTWRKVGSQSRSLVPLNPNTKQDVEVPLEFRRQDSQEASGLLTALAGPQAVPVRIQGTMDINFPSKPAHITFQGETTLQMGR